MFLLTDSIRGVIFAGAVVSWLGPQNGSVTADVSGAYAAAGNPAGAYTVIVTACGCTPGTANVSITAGQTTVQDFSLQCP